MPTLRITTNVHVPSEQRNGLLARASATVGEMLGKPERYVMIILEDGRAMSFAGAQEPTAYLELKSLGLREEEAPSYSHTLYDFLGETLSIPAERIYIELTSPPRHLFGWNRSTF
jgi:phenylpyruvate tautomerase PptA (4-oxalocrotonate tautomerase family)